MQGAGYDRLMESQKGYLITALTVSLQGRRNRVSNPFQHSHGEGRTKTRLEIENAANGKEKVKFKGR